MADKKRGWPPGQPLLLHNYGLLVFDRQIMDVEMAGQAVREHLQLLLVVRFRMAFPAIRNLAMLLVAHGAEHLTMLALCPLPLGVNCIMTAAAGLNLGIIGEADL